MRQLEIGGMPVFTSDRIVDKNSWYLVHPDADMKRLAELGEIKPVMIEEEYEPKLGERQRNLLPSLDEEAKLLIAEQIISTSRTIDILANQLLASEPDRRTALHSSLEYLKVSTAEIRWYLENHGPRG